jgi:hypothetical protein
MEEVAVWVVDEEYGEFKIAHVYRPKINTFLMEKEGPRYESALRNTYQIALNNAVRDSLEKLDKMGKFRGKNSKPKLDYRPTVAADG